MTEDENWIKVEDYIGEKKLKRVKRMAYGHLALAIVTIFFLIALGHTFIKLNAIHNSMYDDCLRVYDAYEQNTILLDETVQGVQKCIMDHGVVIGLMPSEIKETGQIGVLIDCQSIITKETTSYLVTME